MEKLENKGEQMKKLEKREDVVESFGWIQSWKAKEMAFWRHNKLLLIQKTAEDISLHFPYDFCKSHTINFINNKNQELTFKQKVLNENEPLIKAFSFCFEPQDKIDIELLLDLIESGINSTLHNWDLWEQNQKLCEDFQEFLKKVEW